MLRSRNRPGQFPAERFLVPRRADFAIEFRNELARTRMMDGPAYQTLLTALRAIPRAERRERVDLALKELEEAEWRDALKERFDAFSTAQMEKILGINRETGLEPRAEPDIDRILAARTKWRNPS
jgi:hypothetical protein